VSNLRTSISTQIQGKFISKESSENYIRRLIIYNEYYDQRKEECKNECSTKSKVSWMKKLSDNTKYIQSIIVHIIMNEYNPVLSP